MRDVPVALPGLTRAVKLQSKAAKVGFDWPDVSHVYDKLDEEIGELKAAPRREAVRRSLAICSLSLPILRGIWGSTLKSACAPPTRNSRAAFASSRKGLPKKGKKPIDSNLAEMDGLWDEAKAAGR